MVRKQPPKKRGRPPREAVRADDLDDDYNPESAGVSRTTLPQKPSSGPALHIAALRLVGFLPQLLAAEVEPRGRPPCAGGSHGHASQSLTQAPVMAISLHLAVSRQNKDGQ